MLFYQDENSWKFTKGMTDTQECEKECLAQIPMWMLEGAIM